jgi:2-methylcitrate dehydratase PrpD
LQLTEPTLSHRLAAFAVGHPFHRLPGEVVENVGSRVLDILGICVAASPLATSGAIRRFATRQGGRPESQAVGVGGRLPAGSAALVNGTLAHSLDYDDTHLPSVLHPSASVVPAALALAQARGRSGRELLAAVACGLEVCVRVGMAGFDEGSGQNDFFEHGQHATSICGSLGSAVACGLLAGFGETELVHVIGLAASMGSGIIEANRTGGTVKRMHCGWAAHAAVTATELVELGFTGPPTALEGRFGFFQAWLHGKYSSKWLTEGLGEHWEVPRIFFKPYPANHFTHTAVDAAAALRRQGLDIDRVVRLELGVPEPIVRTIGEPIEVKRRPTTGYMAQFSGPYAVAVGLLGGGGLGAGLDDYTDELAQEPRRLGIMAKVDVVPDAECTAIFPSQFPCVLRAIMDDGQQLVTSIMSNRGGPDRPLTFDELALKFRDNAARLLPAEVVDQVQALAGRLHDLPSVDTLLDPLGAPLEAALISSDYHAREHDPSLHS